MKSEHNIENIAVKSAKIDKRIKRLVVWLNKFHSVQTLWSCQGSPQSLNLGPSLECLYLSGCPYVNFDCSNPDQLAIIIDCIQKFKHTSFYEDISEKHKDRGFIVCQVSYNFEEKRLNYDIYLKYIEYADAIVDYYENIYKWQLEKKMKLIP